MKTKNKLVVCSKHSYIRGSKKCCVLIKKDTSKAKNTLLKWILQNVLFQRIEKFDPNKMEFMKGVTIYVKVDAAYNIWKSASHYFLVERCRLNWIIKVFAGACPWMHLPRPSFTKGQTWSCKRQLQKKILILQYRWHWSKLVQISKKVEMDEKTNF